MKFLITGGAGFVGSHLSRRLLEMNHQVVVLDNFYTSCRQNLEEFSQNDSFELIEHDVIIPIELDVDAIFNLACPASPIHYQKYPVETIKTNVLGAINMLNLANKLRVPILQASTSEVYGDPNVNPQPESYWGNVNPIGLRACYDEGKRTAETLFFDHHRQYGLDIKVARIFNTYGPTMSIDDGRVVSNFINQALRSQDITIYGDGSQTRSFCYISDMVEGLIALMNTSSKVTGPINLGNPHEVSMLELAERILNLTGSDSQLVFKELPSDDPRKRKPDISLAQSILKWSPVTGLEDGLGFTIQDFTDRYEQDQ
jgi:UDP-glucuronate decarboxylase